MAYETGTAAGHYDLLDKLRAFLKTNAALVAAGQEWTELRWDGASAERESILQGPGLSGIEEIFIGIKTYQSVPLDYFNWRVAAFTGFVSGNDFYHQPGTPNTAGTPTGDLAVPLYQNSIPYWFVGNGQRAIVVANVQTQYQAFYLGKCLPYATPGQYPYPVVCSGMLTSGSATRYDNTGYSTPFKGARANLKMRFVDGVWKEPEVWPWNNTQNQFPLATGQGGPRNTNADYTLSPGYYGLHPIVLNDAGPNQYGELDGVYWLTGFDNAVENTVTIGADTYLVVRDVWRTGFMDFFAIKLA
ncbi:hypothetical protein [Methylocaldum sp.]|uniref:hypothetical protein n=1 Tax=Methylocaldum sp. TaxID=1969727 RepID=UPI002D2BF600|nr:hypothetical protein [Methylocaldum sp.]HYE35509.1 hypothetical protein [Methylocaldum sp.]